MNIYLKKTMQNLASFPVVTIGNTGLNILKTVAGVAASALSVLTLGKWESINDMTILVCQERFIIAKPYHDFIKILNPYFKFKGSKSLEQPGIVSEKTSAFFYHAAYRNSQSTSPLNKYVFSRALYVLGACTFPIARTTDLALGVLAAAVSIPLLGRCESINNFAITQLGLNFIQDFFIGIRGIVNPQQFREDTSAT